MTLHGDSHQVVRASTLSQGRLKTGFSIVELIAVLLILGVIAFSVMPRLMSNNADLSATRNNIILAFSQAQQIAMARGKSRVIIDSNSLDIQVPDEFNSWKSIDWPGVSYDEAIPNGVTVTNGMGAWEFNKLGATDGGIVELSNGLRITVEASGYAY